MKFHVLISKAAKLDISETFHWYEDRSSGLGSKFETELSEALEELTYEPYKFQIKYRDIRINFLNRFPYGIHFQILEVSSSTLILAIFHTSRKSLK